MSSLLSQYSWMTHEWWDARTKRGNIVSITKNRYNEASLSARISVMFSQCGGSIHNVCICVFADLINGFRVLSNKFRWVLKNCGLLLSIGGLNQIKTTLELSTIFVVYWVQRPYVHRVHTGVFTAQIDVLYNAFAKWTKSIWSSIEFNTSPLKCWYLESLISLSQVKRKRSVHNVDNVVQCSVRNSDFVHFTSLLQLHSCSLFVAQNGWATRFSDHWQRTLFLE